MVSRQPCRQISSISKEVIQSIAANRFMNSAIRATGMRLTGEQKVWMIPLALGCTNRRPGMGEGQLNRLLKKLLDVKAFSRRQLSTYKIIFFRR